MTYRLESGESVQQALVAIANVLGECDNAADLAEAVNVLDKAEHERAGLLVLLQRALDRLHCANSTRKARQGEFMTSDIKAAIAKATP